MVLEGGQLRVPSQGYSGSAAVWVGLLLQLAGREAWLSRLCSQFLLHLHPAKHTHIRRLAPPHRQLEMACLNMETGQPEPYPPGWWAVVIDVSVGAWHAGPSGESSVLQLLQLVYTMLRLWWRCMFGVQDSLMAGTVCARAVVPVRPC